MYIIIGKLAVSVYANFNRQATVGVASTEDADEYDVEAMGVFTDEKIDRAVDILKAKYGDLPVIKR